MQIRKWLALLVSAALALSLLAGCGGKNQSLGQVILDLLDGQYANVAVEIDPDLEGDLRQAVHEGETEEEIRAALEKILGSGVSFRLIGDSQQGDSAWNLILYPGSDPDAAARSAFTEWSKVFGSLPRDGQYTAQIAMIETENGYAILVQATVDKAASRDDDDDDDDEPEEEIPASGYKKTSDTSYKVYNDTGLTSVLFGNNDGSELATDRNSGFEKITIELAANTTYTVSQTFVTTSFKGTLKGEDKETTTITLNEGSEGLFQQIDSKGTVENITFNVQTDITNTYADGVGSCCAGAVAGMNFGNITNCEVKLNGHTINASGSRDHVNAGGLVGYNVGTITDCTVTINGSISATSDSVANAGGIAGDNEGEGEIKGNSQVTIESGGSIQATGTNASAGGLAGQNTGTVDGTYSGGSIQATSTSVSVNANASAGGLAGQNTGTVNGTYSGTGTDTIQAMIGENTASVPNDDDENPNIDTQGNARAGTKIGFDYKAMGPVGF